MITLTSSIIIGFIRLCLIALFVYYLYKKFLQNSPLNFLDFIVQNWFRFAAAYLVVALVLTQLNAYNLFNCFYVFLFILLVDTIGLKNIRKLKQYFATNVKIVFLQTLRSVELNKPIKSWIVLQNPKSEEVKQNNKLIFLVVIMLAFFTFLSRFFFIKYDNYSLSDPWILDLERIIRLDNQQWFGNDFNPMGELALLNFYSKIADITPEISLQFAAILESILLAIMLFWALHKLTSSKFMAPLFATLLFALVYIFSPINVYFLLQTNSILMALTFALPAFVYALNPRLLTMTPFTLYATFTIGFFAIGLTDFFVYFIVVPVFLVLLCLGSIHKNLLQRCKITACYLGSVVLYLSMYGLIAQLKHLELVSFFKTNLVSMSAYSYFPQMLLPLKTIVKSLQYVSGVGMLLGILLQAIKKGNWTPAIVFLLFFNALVTLAEMKYSWVDVEKIKVLFIVLFPLVIGFSLAMVISLFEFVSKPLQRLQPLSIMLVMTAMVFYSFKHQEKPVSTLKPCDKLPKEILNAYDKISQVFYNKTYTVVNDPTAQVISVNRHGFMNYDYFIADYLAKDQLYYKNKKNKLFLASNPDAILPKSVLVFVMNANLNNEHNLLADDAKLSHSVLMVLQNLKNRGRRIQVFYKTPRITVYEIVNEPGESKMHDLVFTRR